MAPGVGVEDGDGHARCDLRIGLVANHCTSPRSMTSLAIIYGLITAITAAAIIFAPEGYEDDHGWHAGREG